MQKRNSEGIYADVSFPLRHEIERTKSARPGRWSKLVPPMREGTARNDQPLDLAGTIRTDGIRVPAPRLELECGGGSPDPEE